MSGQTVFNVHLDVFDQLAIVAGAFTLLAIAVLILVCILSPDCYMYKCCPFNLREDEKPIEKAVVYGSTEGKPFRATIKEKPVPAYWHTMGTLKESDMSDSLSDAGTGDVIELKHDRVKRNPSKYSSSSSTGSVSPTPTHVPLNGRILFTLMYDRVDSKLNIKIQQLVNFSATEPDGATAPYIKVRLYRTPKNFFTFRGKLGKDNSGQNLDVELQTKIQRRSDDPVFNEVFTKSIEQQEIGNYSLKLLICDFDRYTRHIVLGEVVVQLAKVDWLTQTEVKFDEQIGQPVEENLGEMNVSLMFLPTAEKLTITIIKAQGLKVMDPQKNTTDCCVKVVLMYDGRQMKKAKTTVKPNDLNPVYNESITFDVPQYQLENVYLSVSAIHQDVESDKKALIGRLYLGTNFECDAKDQWVEMMHNPRKQIMCWHKLQS
ncbi:synaptotagmin 47 [Lottia gigantea]|uniref:Synaptotagmin 47 n=1 Tax=Lottia gigantea TaxID=225164 RepID=V4BNT9_LOTGI|nr:synaptotagmin 47 [Lottia gigantea]ESO90569.1 synaptotagmin 47 [Lottia gigantea]